MRNRLTRLLTRLACLAVLSGPIVAAEQTTQDDPRMPRRDDLIYVVAHSAVDCSACAIWRKAADGLPATQQWAKTWPKVRMVVIERASLDGSEDASLYPPELRFLYDDRKARYQLAPPTPTFEVVVRDRILMRQSGVQAWSAQVVPAIRILEQNRGATP